MPFTPWLLRHATTLQDFAFNTEATRGAVMVSAEGKQFNSQYGIVGKALTPGDL